MGIDMTIEDEKGIVLDEILDNRDQFSQLLRKLDLQSTHCLQYIVPYTDTIFNQLQASRLVQELVDLESQVGEARERLLLSERAEMVRRHLKSPHLFVKIYGD